MWCNYMYMNKPKLCNLQVNGLIFNKKYINVYNPQNLLNLLLKLFLLSFLISLLWKMLGVL